MRQYDIYACRQLTQDIIMLCKMLCTPSVRFSHSVSYRTLVLQYDDDVSVQTSIQPQDKQQHVNRGSAHLRRGNCSLPVAYRYIGYIRRLTIQDRCQRHLYFCVGCGHRLRPIGHREPPYNENVQDAYRQTNRLVFCPYRYA